MSKLVPVFDIDSVVTSKFLAAKSSPGRDRIRFNTNGVITKVNYLSIDEGGIHCLDPNGLCAKDEAFVRRVLDVYSVVMVEVKPEYMEVVFNRSAIGNWPDITGRIKRMLFDHADRSLSSHIARG